METVAGWKRAYDDDDAVIYLLDAGLRIARCNPAWDRFALANSGENAVAAKVTGSSVLDAVPLGLHDFYRTAYRNVQRHRRDWWHVFECSSAQLRRDFQMRILPAGDGLLIVNTLLRETPAESGPQVNLDDYEGRDGIIITCSHCRRVKNLRVTGAWDWVPEIVWSGKVLSVFGLCDFCIAYHYHRR